MTLQYKIAETAYDAQVKLTVKGEKLEREMVVAASGPLMSMGGSDGDTAEGDIDQLV